MVQIHTFDTDWAIPPKAAENILDLVGGAGGSDPIQRVALNRSTVLDTSAWDREHTRAIVAVQDATGGRTLTIDGVEVPLEDGPLGETVIAAVWTGTRWLAFSSAGSAAPSEPPAWPAGMTATTGEPKDTSVTVTFSAPLPRGTLQVRYGSGDVWRTITASGQTVTLTGLAPSTAYAAPEFRVINAAGETPVLAAQGFTTQAKSKSWTDVHVASFTAPDGTPLADYTPDLGAGHTIGSGDRAAATVQDGHTQVAYTSASYPNLSYVVPLTSAQLSARVEFDYTGASSANRTAGARFGTDRNAEINLGFSSAGITEPSAGALGGGTATETSGLTTLPPTSGRAVIEYQDDTLTLTIDGQLYRSWTIAFGTNYGTISHLTTASVRLGGGDIHAGKAISDVTIDNLRVQEWM